jgi:urease accessory protein
MNFMPARQTQLPVAQRAKGELALGFKLGSRVERFYQQGCLKARLPRAVAPGWAEAVTLNISGGVAGGDTLETAIAVQAGAKVSVASQAAERIYRALGAAAEITTRLQVADGAVLEYLPQETIFFDGFSLRRSLDFSLEGVAEYLGVESLVFGRTAMGEAVRHGSLRDRISLWRNGKRVLQDMTRLEGDVSAQLARRGLGAGALACASVMFVGRAPAARLQAVRAALGPAHAGASCIEGVLFARILAPDGAALRRSVISALNVLRDGRPLPRVWQG